MSIEINSCIGASRACLREYSYQLYGRPNAQLSIKVRVLKAEVVEPLLYRCAAWTLRSEDFDNLYTVYHK
ncbi:unnamed protein product, partial [Sphacelaria rigidula]